MHDLDRIEHLLASKELDADTFERCAQDLLSDLFPGLNPIPGGSDWGRDADIVEDEGLQHTRLLATSSQDKDGVAANLRRGLRSMQDHGVPFSRIVVACCASLTLGQRRRLAEVATTAGARLDQGDIFDRRFFASKLRRDSYWRERLLGLSSETICLSRAAPKLAESPWAQLPLVGREDELAALQSCTGDVVLAGSAGLGKSRLMQELGGIVFVDRDALSERVAADVRWVRPEVVGVDDAGASAPLLRQLLAMRRGEPDVFSYRVVASCWPDEVQAVTDLIEGAEVLQIDPLERSHMDTILVALGVTSQLARSEILGQAEGRPGWAVALGDLLLKAKDGKSLLEGRELLGQATKALRRRGAASIVIDLLATVAALGYVVQQDLQLLADELGQPRPTVATMLREMAQGGLVDVEQVPSEVSGGTIRRHTIRPPMLARVLVAERAFGVAPAVDLERLLERWPDRLFELTCAAMHAARLGREDARASVDSFLERALSSLEVPHVQRLALLELYAPLDRRAGEQVLTICRRFFDEATAGGEIEGWTIEPVIGLVSLVARLYSLELAIELLLDACMVDRRAAHSTPGHPVRQIEEFIGRFHPEIPLASEPRYLVARVSRAWVLKKPDDAQRWVVYAQVVQRLLSFHVRSGFTHPGDVRQFKFIDALVPPSEMERVFERVWPGIRALLTPARPELISAVIEAAREWLRIGSGHQWPAAHTQAPETITKAKKLGEALVGQLATCDLGVGSMILLRKLAAFHGIELDVTLPSGWQPFLGDIDPDMGLASSEQLSREIRDEVKTWADNSAIETARRLLEIKQTLMAANLLWPDRVWIATSALAEFVGDSGAWLEASLEQGLLPEACAFVRRLLEQGILTRDQAQRILRTSGRWEFIGIVLSAGASPSWLVEHVLDEVTAGDFPAFETLMLRQQLPLDRVRRLLGRSNEAVRGVLALAMYWGRHPRDTWDPGQLEEEWLEAVSHFRAVNLPRAMDYETARLFSFLAEQYPSGLVRLVRDTLEEASDAKLFSALSHSSWETLCRLPGREKRFLWDQFPDRPTARWLLRGHLIGADVAWLEEMLDAGAMTSDEAFDTFSGMDPQPSIDHLARLLVPRGIEPVRLAGLLALGGWVGEHSDRYGALVEQCQQLVSHDDPNVRSVGEAGLRMFTDARDRALQQERQKRIRGEM